MQRLIEDTHEAHRQAHKIHALPGTRNVRGHAQVPAGGPERTNQMGFKWSEVQILSPRLYPTSGHTIHLSSHPSARRSRRPPTGGHSTWMSSTQKKPGPNYQHSLAITDTGIPPLEDT